MNDETKQIVREHIDYLTAQADRYHAKAQHYFSLSIALGIMLAASLIYNALS